jgi:hypothetical protein
VGQAYPASPDGWDSQADVLRVLETDGVVDALGPDRVHGNINQAVRAQLEMDVAD